MKLKVLINFREPLKTLNVMLNLFQHLPKFRRLTASSSASLRLRVMPAMTGALQKGFLEVPFIIKPFIRSEYE